MLKMKLRIKPFCNELHFFLFAVVLLLIAIQHPLFYFVLAGYLIFIIKKTKYFFPITIVLLLIFSSYQIRKLALHELASGEYEETYEVLDVLTNEIILKGDTKIVIFSTQSELTPGDIIKARLKIYQLEEASYSGDFDAKKYYFAKGITNRGKILKYEVIQSKWNIAKVRYKILNYYESCLKEKSFTYLKALIFGITDLDKEVKRVYSILYLSHILAISGLHITFLYSILIFIFQKFFRLKGDKITILILCIYGLLIGFPTSCLRALLFLILGIWNEKGELRYTKLDILSISFIAMVLISPLQAFQMGFILSYIISFVLIFMKEYNLSKRKVVKAFQCSLLCIFSILPFLINQTNEISIVGILLSFILGYFFSKCIFPLTFAMLLFPCAFYEVLFKGLDQGLIFITKYTYSFSLPHISFFGGVVYYIIFLFILLCLAKNIKKWTLLLIPLYLFTILSLRFLNPFYRVTFIDVGQGDSILIELPFEQGNILVDCYNGTKEYLKSIGVRKLDYVVLSHFDNDHIKTIDQVVEEFQIGTILYSKYEDISKIKNLKMKKEPIGSGDVFRVGDVSFYVLGPIRDMSDANGNSVVLKFKLNEYDFLLTGDITSSTEKELLLKYDRKLDCDVLKVAHHGSKTSSTYDFISVVSPIYSIISVGENNSYGLPNFEVVERLKKFSNVYLTKESGNIQIFVRETLSIKFYRS